MLKGIPEILSPELIKILAEMGHGDEIVIADANFPSESMGRKVVRADGIGGAKMLDAVLSLIPLDADADRNFLLMQPVAGVPTPTIWAEYFAIAKGHDDNVYNGALERYAFYARAKDAYAVIATGERAIYANVILKKGVIN